MADYDPRASRKWALTKGALILYTLMHILNLGVALLTRWVGWLDNAALQSQWTTSLTIWSGGVIFILGLYFGANVVQKKIENGRGK